MIPSMELSDEALEALVRRHRELGSQIAELKGEQDEIKTRIDDGVAVGWSLNVDGVKASKREPNRSFDMVTAVTLLSPEAKEACIQRSFDPKAVRDAVEKAGLLDECMVSDLAKSAVVKI